MQSALIQLHSFNSLLSCRQKLLKGLFEPLSTDTVTGLKVHQDHHKNEEQDNNKLPDQLSGARQRSTVDTAAVAEKLLPGWLGCVSDAWQLFLWALGMPSNCHLIALLIDVYGIENCGNSQCKVQM